MSDVYKAPEAPLNEASGSGNYGSVESALAGNYELQPVELIKEAWANLKGLMAPYWIAMVIYMVVAMIFSGLQAAMASPSGFGLMYWVIQLVSMVVLAPMAAGLMMICIKHSVGSPIEFGEIFKHFDKTLNLFITSLLMYIAIGIGFLLLVLPGIYLMVAFSMAMPLVVEKNMSPIDALKTSLKTVNHKWFNMGGLILLSIVVIAAGAIALLVGLVWAIPVVSLAYAICYRNIFGVEASTKSQ